MKFCDVNCQTKYNRDILIDRWLKDPSKFESTPSCVRWWFINKYGEKCMICGWNEINPYTKKIPLELHHINGNWKNNYPDNIEMICANCHTLTPTYRGANRGKGREWSKEYYRGKTTRK